MEAARAVKAKAAGETLVAGGVAAIEAVEVLHAEASCFVVVNKPAGVYVDDLFAAMRRHHLVRAGRHEVGVVTPRFDVRPSSVDTGADPGRMGDGARAGGRHRDGGADGGADGVDGASYLNMVHRLDRDTSGCLVFARSPEANKALARAFQSGLVHKEYVAHCGVCPPQPQHDAPTVRPLSASMRASTSPESSKAASPSRDVEMNDTSGEVEVCTGHGRSAHGLWRVYARSDVGRSLPGGGRGTNAVKEMTTRLRVMARGGPRASASHNGEGGRPDLSMETRFVRAVPVTGRTHQIRLHCAHVGMPLVGDVKYGGPDVLTAEGADGKGEGEVTGFRLHAATIRFPHPMTNEEVTVRASPPAWWPRELNAPARRARPNEGGEGDAA